MLTRLRHIGLLLLELFRFSVATRNFWLLPFMLVLLTLSAVAAMAEAVVPYAIYPIF